MQQALYPIISNSGRTTNAAPGTAARGVGLRQWIARRWDLVGVITLIGSSAAYGVFALAHLA